MELISPENPVFSAYAFYSVILGIKILAMFLLTKRQRVAKKVVSNVEDLKRLDGAKIVFNDDDVERVRRAHRNDLENIPVFFVIGFLYVLTNPSPVLAVTLFRVFTIARVIHTIVYAVVVRPQPARFIAFAVGLCITLYMAVQVFTHFM